MSVWEGLGMCVYLPFQKNSPFQILKCFLLLDCGRAEVLTEVQMVAEDTLMLMRILFGCH